jgi:hypothetical protein
MEIHIPPMLAAQSDFPSGPLKGSHNIFDPRMPFEIYTFQETISTNNLGTPKILGQLLFLPKYFSKCGICPVRKLFSLSRGLNPV